MPHHNWNITLSLQWVHRPWYVWDLFYSGGEAPLSHNNGHPYTTYKEPGSVKIWLGHLCDVCGQGPIVGYRWQCQTCPSYDLCYVCFGARLESKGHRSSHTMTGYVELGSIPSKRRTQRCRHEVVLLCITCLLCSAHFGVTSNSCTDLIFSMLPDKLSHSWIKTSQEFFHWCLAEVQHQRHHHQEDLEGV